MQVASFTAGFKQTRPFYLILFAVLIFSAGVNARPTAEGYTTIGVLGEPGAAERMFAAVERGAHGEYRSLGQVGLLGRSSSGLSTRCAGSSTSFTQAERRKHSVTSRNSG